MAREDCSAWGPGEVQRDVGREDRQVQSRGFAGGALVGFAAGLWAGRKWRGLGAPSRAEPEGPRGALLHEPHGHLAGPATLPTDVNCAGPYPQVSDLSPAMCAWTASFSASDGRDMF